MNAPTHLQRQPIADAQRMPCLLSMLAAALLLAGCTTPIKVAPSLPTSEGHLGTARDAAPVANVPAPVRISGTVPPPKLQPGLATCDSR